jgi:glycosyltransferase involved in cell wall biosynthesis
MISGRDVIIISSIEWNFLWQGPQEIATRLAQAGNRVLYVENTGVRSPSLRDAKRIALRLSRWVGSFSSDGSRAELPNLNVSSPVVLPPLGSRWQRELNRLVFLRQVHCTAAKLQIRNPVILTFLPTDTALDLVQLLRGDDGIVVYYCAADFAELCSRPERLVESEQELLRLCDLVLAQCSPLASHCAQWADNIHIIPYGVNVDVFSRPPTRPVKDPIRNVVSRDFKSPVIGYVGGLHRHIDLDLMTSMAQSRPHWSWVCIGPTQTPLGKFATLPNVHLLGEFEHNELAEQIERFDVGIVPYVNSIFTDTVVPTKINEYLAMGKPVVSTALPAVCEYYRWPGVVMPSEPRHDSFIAAIEAVLGWPKTDAAKALRRDVAKLSDWPGRLEHICTLIDAAIKTKNCKDQPAVLRKKASA